MKINSHKLPRRIVNTFTKGLTNQLNDTYIDAGAEVFTQKFAKINHLEPKLSYEKQRASNRKLQREVVSSINVDHSTSSTSRLYGSEFSLKEWDRHRMATSFEIVPEALLPMLPLSVFYPGNFRN